MRMITASLAALIGLLAVPLIASAVVVVRPDGARIHQGDWTFVPVVSVTDSTTADVLGALALRDSSAAGNNFTAIWYENPHVLGMKWHAVTWTSPNQWDAVKWLSNVYDIDPEWGFMWPIAADPSADPTVAVPVGYDNGLLEGDPLADIGDSETHADIVKVLVDAGYAAASVQADKDGPCDSSVVLPALQDLTTINLLFSPTEEELQGALATMVDAGCASGSLAAWHPVPPLGARGPGYHGPPCPATRPPTRTASRDGPPCPPASPSHRPRHASALGMKRGTTARPAPP